jgi:hypothetical protein
MSGDEIDMIESDAARRSDAAQIGLMRRLVLLYRAWDEAERNASLRAPVHPSMGQRWSASRGST